MAKRNLLPLLCGWVTVVCILDSAIALETLSLGKEGSIRWDGSGADLPTIDPEYRALDPNEILIGNTPGGLIDFNHPDYRESLVPRQLSEGENIAVGTKERGGNIRAPTVLDFTDNFRLPDLELALEELLSEDRGGELLAFERKNFNALGMLIIIDLGARFGVNRIRFYPRNTVHPAPSTPFQNDFMRAFELFVNDGLNLNRGGNPIWELLAENKDNREPVVDVVLDPPQYIRSVRLRSATPINFEIDEIEVYGTGFLPTAQYISDVFDLGFASWGNIQWVERAVGDSSKSHLLISTRTGNDETPFVYTRKLADKRDAPEIPTSIVNRGQPLTREEYSELPMADAADVEWTHGSVKNDLENWSPWSSPYTPEGSTEAGTSILSPGPRRYIQFRVQVLSEDLESARVLDRISLEYLSPPLSEELVAEIFPREVEASTSTLFTYAVSPKIETPGLRGFDTFEVSTPLRVEAVERIEILDSQGGLVAEHTFTDLDTLGEGPFWITSVEDNRFGVRFPLIQENDDLLKITFRASVLVFSTEFKGRASLSTESGAFQNIAPGNTADLGEGDDPNLSGITVFSPSVLKGRLIDAFEATPNPFTPNGDGINDQISVVYNVLTLTKTGRVVVRVYDLAGRVLHTLHDGLQQSGRYLHGWDGVDNDGHRVPPGIYLLQVSVEGDNRADTQVRPLAVVY